MRHALVSSMSRNNERKDYKMKDTILERFFMISMLTIALASIAYAMGALISLNGTMVILNAIQGVQ